MYFLPSFYLFGFFIFCFVLFDFFLCKDIETWFGCFVLQICLCEIFEIFGTVFVLLLFVFFCFFWQDGFGMLFDEIKKWKNWKFENLIFAKKKKLFERKNLLLLLLLLLWLFLNEIWFALLMCTEYDEQFSSFVLFLWSNLIDWQRCLNIYQRQRNWEKDK